LKREGESSILKVCCRWCAPAQPRYANQITSNHLSSPNLKQRPLHHSTNAKTVIGIKDIENRVSNQDFDANPLQSYKSTHYRIKNPCYNVAQESHRTLACLARIFSSVLLKFIKIEHSSNNPRPHIAIKYFSTHITQHIHNVWRRFVPTPRDLSICSMADWRSLTAPPPPNPAEVRMQEAMAKSTIQFTISTCFILYLCIDSSLCRHSPTYANVLRQHLSWLIMFKSSSKWLKATGV